MSRCALLLLLNSSFELAATGKPSRRRRSRCRRTSDPQRRRRTRRRTCRSALAAAGPLQFGSRSPRFRPPHRSFVLTAIISLTILPSTGKYARASTAGSATLWLGVHVLPSSAQLHLWWSGLSSRRASLRSLLLKSVDKTARLQLRQAVEFAVSTPIIRPLALPPNECLKRTALVLAPYLEHPLHRPLLRAAVQPARAAAWRGRS